MGDELQTMIVKSYATYGLDFLHGAKYISWSSESTFNSILSCRMAKYDELTN